MSRLNSSRSAARPEAASNNTATSVRIRVNTGIENLAGDIRLFDPLTYHRLQGLRKNNSALVTFFVLTYSALPIPTGAALLKE
jgi:hypothetical protein